ncbi:MAG: cytochrome b [Caulobacteraceae bacterium]|nr:cytochrome b [Caulobacteraceae bacterium]
MPTIDPRRYNAVAMSLHWLIAALILTNIGLAWYFNTLTGLPKIPPIQLHKSIGITVLILSLLRLGWRLAVPPPPLPASVTRRERLAAGAAYVLFYVVMIGMPLSGWALSSASKVIQIYPITLYGVVKWPAIAPLTQLPPPQMKAAHGVFVTTHELLAKLAYALIVLHVAAALRHQFLKRDAVLSRMVPFIRRPAT